MGEEARHREAKRLAQGHTRLEKQCWYHDNGNGGDQGQEDCPQVSGS